MRISILIEGFQGSRAPCIAWFSDVRGRSRSLSLPSLSHLIYSVQSRVHDVRAPFCIWKANHNARKKWSVNKPVLHGWIETIHIVHIAILIWLDVWEITFHTFHTFQNMVYALWLVKIDNGSDVMNTTSHRVYQTREGGKRKGPRTTSDVWESGYPM